MPDDRPDAVAHDQPGDDQQVPGDQRQQGQPQRTDGAPDPTRDGGQPPSAGRGAGRSHARQGGPTLVDKLQEDGPMDAIKFSTGVYLALGLGYALTFLLANELASSGSGSGQTFSVAAAFIVGLALAPLMAVVIGLRTGRELDEATGVTAATTFVGTAVGVVVMSLVLFVLATAFSSGGGGGAGGGDFPVGVIVGFLVGVGATGAMGAYVGDQLGTTAGV